jgi:hypothetical protein
MISGSRIERMLALSDRFAREQGESLGDVFREARSAFAELLASDDVAAELHSYLADYSAGRVPSIEAGKEGEIVLYNDGRTFVSVALYEESARTLHSHPVRGLFAVLSGAPFTKRRYALPEDWRNDVFRKGAKLRYLGEERVSPGDCVELDGTRHVLWFGYGGPVIVAKYLVITDAVQTWAFDHASLEALDAEGVSPEWDSLMNSASLLRAIASPGSVAGLLELSRHPAHFVRWEAIKSLAYIDRARGTERVAEALFDPHPEVAVAAAKALVKLTALQE